MYLYCAKLTFFPIINVLFLSQRRLPYYENLFIANKGDVESHMNMVYANSPNLRGVCAVFSEHSTLSLLKPLSKL